LTSFDIVVNIPIGSHFLDLFQSPLNIPNSSSGRFGNLTDTSRGSSHFGRKFDHMNHIPIFGDLEEPFFYVNFDIFSGQKKQTKIYRFLFYHFSPKPLKVTGMQNAAWPGLGSNLGATLFS